MNHQYNSGCGYSHLMTKEKVIYGNKFRAYFRVMF